MSIPFLFLLSMILTSMTSAFLAVLLLATAYKDRVARAFSWVSIWVALWALFYILWQLFVANHSLALKLIQIAVICIIFITTSFVNFATRFGESISNRSYAHYRKIAYSLAILLCGLLFFDIFAGTRFIVGTAGPKFWFSYWPDPGLFFEPFLLYFTGGFIFGFLLLLKLRHTASRSVKMQINYLVFSIAMAVSAGTTLYIIWYNIPFPPLGGFLVPVYVIASFYAITRHHLFNLKVITAEALTFVVWVFMFSRILLATNSQERVLNVGTFIFVVLLGTYIIRSVLNEVNQRERAEELTIKLNSANAELKDLNDNLQQKVSEQTEEIRKAYEVEKKARIELEDLDKAKDQFILTTQHHLRTPLTIIRGFLQTSLKEDPKALTPKVSSYLTKASTAAERMAKLINDFLGVSQLEVGKGIFRFQPVNMKTLIEEIRDELAPEVDKKNLTFVVDFSPDAATATPNVDRESIKAAFFNLIDNAVKYTPKGGITVTASLSMHPIEKNQWIRIDIRDTGIGIPKEELPKLFDRYFQRGTEAEKIYTTGRGIGLVLAKNIIKAHHGEVVVESAGVGKGSEFKVELPMQ